MFPRLQAGSVGLNERSPPSRASYSPSQFLAGNALLEAEPPQVDWEREKTKKALLKWR